MSRIFTLLVTLMLMGCASLVPSTVARLSAISPLEADPAVLAVALVLPAGLQAAPGSAKLIITATRDDTGTRLAHAFILQATPAQIGGITVPPGSTAQLFRVAGADIAILRAMQTEMAQWKAEAPAGATAGTIEIGLGGCVVGAGPAADATASAYIRTSEGGPFLPLIVDGSLRQLLGDDVFAAIGPCHGPR
jgi:hypothetical protein